MEKRANIPALGIVCYTIRISKARALYGYTFRKIETASSDNVNFCWRSTKKSFITFGDIKPYRKPTQVGRSRRLRRTRETWLRNSAKQRP